MIIYSTREAECMPLGENLRAPLGSERPNQIVGVTSVAEASHRNKLDVSMENPNLTEKLERIPKQIKKAPGE